MKIKLRAYWSARDAVEEFLSIYGSQIAALRDGLAHVGHEFHVWYIPTISIDRSEKQLVRSVAGKI